MNEYLIAQVVASDAVRYCQSEQNKNIEVNN